MTIMSLSVPSTVEMYPFVLKIERQAGSFVWIPGTRIGIDTTRIDTTSIGTTSIYILLV